MPLLYAQLVKYLVGYAARELAARLGLQIGPSRSLQPQKAPVPGPGPTPDEAFELAPPVAERELSEEERLNRQPFYEQGRLEGRREGDLEERAREQERRRVEESRDPEILARDEERRREDFFREEAERKREEQEGSFREQDAQRQQERSRKLDSRKSVMKGRPPGARTNGTREPVRRPGAGKPSSRQGRVKNRSVNARSERQGSGSDARKSAGVRPSVSR
jgi:hypothetical protein